MADVIGTASIKIVADGSDFPSSLAKLGGAIEKSANAAGQGAGKALTQGVNQTAVKAMNGVANSIGDSLSGVVPVAARAGQGAGDALSEGLVGGATRAAAGATDALGEVSAGAARAGQGAANAMSQGLGQITGDATRAAAGASDALSGGMASAGTKAANAVDDGFEITAPLAAEATESAKAAEKSLVSGMTKAAKSAVNATTKVMKTGLKVGVGAAAAGAAAVVGKSLSGGAKRLTSIDQASKKLEALGNDTKEVAKIMDAATAAVKGTAFGLDEAATAASMLGAAGVKTKDMEQALSNIASTASIAGTGMADLTPIFTDAAAAGKITGDTLMRLESQGIAASQMMAKDMGISVAQLKKEVSEGNVSFQEFSDTMENSLGPAAKIAGESFLGMSKNVGAAMGRVGATALTPVFEGLKATMQSVIDVFDRFNAILKPFIAEHGPAIIAIFSAISDGINSIDFKGGADFSAVGEAVGNLANTVKDGFVNALGNLPEIIARVVPAMANMLLSQASFLVDAVTALISALGPAISVAFPILIETFAKLIPEFANAIFIALPVLVDALSNIINRLVAVIPTFVPALLNAAVTLFRAILSGLMQNLPAILEGIVALIVAVVQALLAQLPMLLQGAINLFLALVAAVLEVLPELLLAIGELLPAIIDTLFSMIPMLLDGALMLFMAIVQALPEILPALIEALIRIFPMFLKALMGMLPELIEAAFQLFMGIVKAIPQIISALVQAIRDLWPKIKSAFSEMIPKMIQTGKDMINGLVQGIKDMITTVVDTIKDLGNKVINAFKNLFGIGSPSKVFSGFGKDIIQGMINGIKDMATNAINAVKDIGNKVIGKFKGMFGISSPSKVFKGYGHNIIQGLVNGLEGSASEAENSVERIVAKILDTEGLKNKSTLVKYVETQGAMLVNLLNAQDLVLDDIKDQQKVLDDMQKESAQMAAGIQSGLVGEFDISKGVKKKPGGDSSISFDTIAGNLSSVASKVTKFAGKIEELLKAGYPNSIVQQVAALGTEKGIAVADALLSATETQQGDFLKDWETLNTAGGAAGQALADDMFKVGIDAQQGLVDGLLANEALLDSAAKSLSDTLTAYVKKHLGVKSPSKVFEGIGKNLGLGLIKGLEAMELPVSKAMAAMTGKTGTGALSAPRVSVPSSSSGVPGSSSVGSGGDTFNVTVEVAMEDLAQLKDFGEFIKMLRVRTRMGTSGGSGV